MRLVLLVGPTILLVFAASFVLAWTFDRRRRHLLVFGASCLLFCLGTLSQILQIPPGAGPNAVVSAFIYTASVLAFTEGLLARTGKRTSLAEKAAITLLIVGGIAYFYYVDRDLLVRIYILNFGYGLICLATAWRLRDMRKGRLTERVLFWTLLAFALHFFPRTILTVGVAAPDPAQFGLSPFWLALQFSLAVLGVALALALLAVTVGDVIDDLRRTGNLDPLTGILNRRGFEEGAAQRLADRHSHPLCLVIADIDRFKNINDTLGHPAGDEVLRTFAALVRRAMRRGDLGGRFGGEEFVLLLSGCDAEGAAAFAERLRASVSEARFGSLPDGWQVTASFGLAEARAGESLGQLVARADAALYAAKRAGRNRVRRHGAIPA
ncbi:GGDEF domain-containing protein (plasmid) [Chelatococcus daeguensis]|uniref:diguanylate cyclase n=1 Tax=Chelatococcus daeguensis TaxID=444444 RepID=A0AAC9P199_9HYPH|nr:GGDEF domain-containing protein [Chelatococcus daeguensis]